MEIENSNRDDTLCNALKFSFEANLARSHLFDEIYIPQPQSLGVNPKKYL